MNAIEDWRQPRKRRPATPEVALARSHAERPPTVMEAVERMAAASYSGQTRANAMSLLGGGRFQAFLAERRITAVHELSRRDLRAFHDGLRDAVGAATRNKYRQYLTRLARWCAATPGYTMASDNGVADAELDILPSRVPKDDVRVLSPDQEQGLRRAITAKRDETLLDLLLGSGVRPGEACGLATNDCHLTQEAARQAGCSDPVPHLHVRRGRAGGRTTKDFETRTVPILPPASRRLRRWLERERPPASRLEVFFSQKRSPQGDLLPLTVNAIQSLFDRLSASAGIRPPLVPYVTRHTWATRTADAGVPPYHLMQAGGWADLQMVMRYYHTDTRRMLEEFNRRFRG